MGGALLGLMLLGGCEAIAERGQPLIAEIPPADAALRLDAAGAGSTRLVRYADRNELEEYLAHEDGEMRAELLFIAATDDRYALVDRLDIEGALARFAYVAGRHGPLGPSEAVDLGAVRGFYRTFELAAENRHCIGLGAGWDERSDDPDRRPSKLLFGYLCTSPGAPLPPVVARELAERAFARRLPDDPYAVTAMVEGEPALGLAREGPSSDGGVPDFPWLFARHYQEEGPTELPPG